MAKIGHLLSLLVTLLLISLPIKSNAQSTSCYCTGSWTNDPRTGYQFCPVNSTCWACQPGAYDTTWQSYFCNGVAPAPPPPPPPTCQPSSESKTEACPIHYSGSKILTRTSTCPDPYGTPLWGPWTVSQDTCKQDPPTCKVSAETRTVACDSGYTGAIEQVRASSCPDPYGSPVWGDWAVSSNTCVKSMTNPTNPTSPVSPLNPASAVATPVVTPAQVPVPQELPIMSAPEVTSQPEQTSKETETKTTTSTGGGTADSSSKTEKSESTGSSSSSGKPKIGIGGFGTALSLELFVKPGIQQPNVFIDIPMNQELPNEYRFSQDFFIDLITGGDTGRAFNDLAGDRWRSLRWDNPIQQSGFGD